MENRSVPHFLRQVESVAERGYEICVWQVEGEFSKDEIEAEEAGSKVV